MYRKAMYKLIFLRIVTAICRSESGDLQSQRAGTVSEQKKIPFSPLAVIPKRRFFFYNENMDICTASRRVCAAAQTMKGDCIPMKLRRTLSCMMALLLVCSLPVSALADTYDLAQGSVTVNAT